MEMEIIKCIRKCEFNSFSLPKMFLALPCLFAFLLFIWWFIGRNEEPPGPPGIPIFGFMPFLLFNPPVILSFLGKVFGPVYSIRLGNYRVVVLNDAKAIKEGFKEENFSGRPDLNMLEVRNGGVKQGLVCSEGRKWGEQRRFTLRHLRSLGLSQQITDSYAHAEIDEFLSFLGEAEEKVVDVKKRIQTAVLNVIWQIVCGERYKHGDSRMRGILDSTNADLADTVYVGPLPFLPWLTRLFPRLTRWNEFKTSVKESHAFLRGIIQEHKRTFDPSNIRDFIDAYLLEIYKTKDQDSSFYKSVGDHSLLVVLLDLFMAGADTTSTTLLWAFLYMINYPEVQEKVGAEIDAVLGTRKPTRKDKKEMFYTQAVLLEVHRKCSLVPIGLFHSAIEDTKFRGFRIKKNSVIIGNLYNVHNCPKTWGDPELFRPERFLNEDKIGRFEDVLAFSTGRRACPGEAFANEQLFIFFVRILQGFSLCRNDANPPPTEKPNVGIVLSPKSFTLIPKKRKFIMDQHIIT